MQITNDGYILTRNVVKVDIKKNRFLKFIKTHKFLILILTIFFSLVIVEGILLNMFVKLLLRL